MAVVRESRQEASPEPDSNVNQLLSAIASCSSMRQKAMLATRQLAEACTPPRGRFRENGFVVAQKGALAHLLPVADKFGTDPEIIANIARIIYGVAFGLQEYSAQDPRGLEQTEADNGGVLLTFLLEKASEDPSLVEDLETLIFPSVVTLARIQAPLEVANVAYYVLKVALDSPPPGIAHLITASCEALVKLEGAPEAMWEIGATSVLLSMADQPHFVGDAKGLTIVHSSLSTCHSLAASKCFDIAALPLLLGVLKTFKLDSKVVDACESTLLVVLDPLEIPNHLSNINSEDEDARTNAFNFLEACASVRRLAAVLVEHGAVASVLAATQSVASEMTTEEHYVALGAGMTLLARMGELGESVAVELYNNNVVATLVDAMSVLDHSPEGLGTAVCDCSRALVVIPDCSVELYNQGVFSALLTSILSYCETSPQFATAVFNLLLAACEDFDELQQAVVAEEGLQTACSALVYHQDNVRYQVSGLELIHMMVVHVATLKEFMAMGGKTVAQRLVGNSSSAAIPMRALDILVEMSSRPDARKVASDNSLIDFALMAASNHYDPDVLSKSRQICTAMATTDDAKRHAERFAASLANREKDQDSCNMALAACAGLAHIPGCAEVFLEAKCLDAMFKVVEALFDANVKTTASIESQRVFLARLTSAMTAMAANSSEVPGEVLVGMLKLCASDKVGQAKEVFSFTVVQGKRCEESGRPLVQELLISAREIAELGMLDEKKINNSLKWLLSGLKRLEGLRDCAVGCMEVLTSLAGDGADLVVQEGLPDILRDIMKRHQYQRGLQTAGVNLLLAVMGNSNDFEKSKAAFRQSGLQRSVEAVIQNHDGDVRLQAGRALTQLLTQDDILDLSRNFLGMCNDALKHKSEVNLRNSLRLMTNVGDSPEGGQALAKLDFPKVYRQVVDVFRDSSDIQNILATLAESTSATPPAAVCHVKYGNLETVFRHITAVTDVRARAHVLTATASMLSVTDSTGPPALLPSVAALVGANLTEVEVMKGGCKVLAQLATRSDVVSHADVRHIITATIGSFPPSHTAELLQCLTETRNEAVCMALLADGAVGVLLQIADTTTDAVTCSRALQALDNLASAIPKFRETFDQTKTQADPTPSDVFKKTGNAMNHHAASDPLVSCSALNFLRQYAISTESDQILNRRLLAGIKVGIAAFPFDAKVMDVVCGALEVNEAVVKFLESIDGEELIKTNMKAAIKEVDNGAAIEVPVARLSVMLRAPINRPDSTLKSEGDYWAACVKRSVPDQKTLLVDCLDTCRVLVDHFPNEGGTHGIKFAGPMTKKAVEMVNTNVLETKVTLIAALAFLAAVGRTDGATQAEMVKTVAWSGIVSMLHTHRADGDVVSVLMRLMGSLDEKDGKKYLFGKGLSEEDVLSSLRRHRKNSQVQQSCGAFLAQQFKNISSAKHDHTINEIYASGRFNVPDPHASSQALDNFGAIVTNNKKCPGSIKNQRIMEKVTRAMEMQTRNSNTDGLIGKLIPLLTISLQ